MIGAIWKPWFVRRPGQLVRRVWRGLVVRPSGPVVVRLPWRVDLEVDPRETIGRAIWTTGIYDLAVSEALWRLTRPGDVVVDAGANIGYMTGLLGVRAGAAGRVLAFEPHPAVCERLRGNVARLTGLPNAAPVDVRQTGLSAEAATATLLAGAAEAANDGLAYIGSGDGIAIRTERLDDVVGDGTVGVMKVDVEGHEPAVLAGASRLLARRGIRCVVFEDHAGPGSDVMRVFVAAGYRVYALGWRMRGPVLADPTGPPVCRPYEAPSYLAVADPVETEAVMRRPAWELFG